MNTIAIDTYKMINKLTAKGFTTEQAEGIIETITESDHVTNGSLKSMLQETAQELKLEMRSQRVNTIKWVAGMLLAQAALVATLERLLDYTKT
ncbi:MAG: hypothetical protein H6779_03745 [Candidatus Nomurabacteria bacterium]|nr:MAG: hypothetical protein H6779_03745 [Candidatus Nomurabacteria bacterium]